jgi:hypothetical protein
MRGVFICPAFLINNAKTIEYCKKAMSGKVTIIQADRERAEAVKPVYQRS